MNLDRWDTWAPNQSKFPYPARVCCYPYSMTLLPQALTLSSVVFATIPVLFATKPPLEPYQAINWSLTFSKHSQCVLPPPRMFLPSPTEMSSFHYPAYQLAYHPSNLKIKTKHRQNHTHTFYILFDAFLDLPGKKGSLSDLTIKYTHLYCLFYLWSFWTLVTGTLSLNTVSHWEKRTRNRYLME